MYTSINTHIHADTQWITVIAHSNRSKCRLAPLGTKHSGLLTIAFCWIKPICCLLLHAAYFSLHYNKQLCVTRHTLSSTLQNPLNGTQAIKNCRPMEMYIEECHLSLIHCTFSNLSFPSIFFLSLGCAFLLCKTSTSKKLMYTEYWQKHHLSHCR